MGRALVFSAPRTVGYEDYPDDPLPPDGVRIKTLFSGISAGTELTQYRGTNPYLHKRWDANTRLFLPGEETTLTYPIRTLGYEEVGQVVERGAAVEDIPLGAYIFGTWGHRTHHVATAEYARAHLMPAGLEPVLGIFSHIGAVALNGVHDGRVRIGRDSGRLRAGCVGSRSSRRQRVSRERGSSPWTCSTHGWRRPKRSAHM